jgi:hypothetical protein
MKKLTVVFAVAVVFVSTASFGQVNLHRDSFGNTTGVVDGQRVVS